MNIFSFETSTHNKYNIDCNSLFFYPHLYYNVDNTIVSTVIIDDLTYSLWNSFPTRKNLSIVLENYVLPTWDVTPIKKLQVRKAY